MIRAKKYLGQHFLKNQEIAKKITESLQLGDLKNILEIGPGMGALTKFLVKKKANLFLIEIDKESVEYLRNHYPWLDKNLIEKDFLKWKPEENSLDNFALIGNFPYNISSQIIFKLLDFKDKIPACVGMFQKEVALRLASREGSRIYGKTSVLLQAFYEVAYLFEVPKEAFFPPPKVTSAVLRMKRKEKEIPCKEKIFFQLVKQSFSQRRKTLKNNLKAFYLEETLYKLPFLKKRPEELSVEDFIELSLSVEQNT